MSNTHEWCAEGIEPEIGNLQDLPIAAAPKMAATLRERENVIIPDVQALDEEWAAERGTLEVQDIQSAMMIPLIIGSQVLGFTGFDAVRTKKVWDREKISLLRVMSDLVAATLQRRGVDEERSRLMRELTTARDEAQAANRAKDDFLAVMSHELRTPLNPIMGFSEILRETCTQEPEREYVETIMESAQRQLKLVNSILNYSRLDKMSIKPRGDRFHLLPVFREALNDVQCIADGLSLEMLNGSDEWRKIAPAEPAFAEILPSKAEPVDEDQQVMLDHGMLRQLLDNLLSNACKYSEEGSVTLKVGLIPAEQSPAMADPPQNERSPAATGVRTLCFAVEDTGIGISDDLLGKLFDPFTQADNSYTREYEGAGLGLAICRKLADTLGGSITVSSSMGKGSCFLVKLPVKLLKAQPRATQSAPPAEEPTRLLDSLHVLIVDDRSDNALLLKTLVKKFGGTATVCYNGQDCLKKFDEEDFGLIFMDLAMPEKDGYETVAEISKRAGSKPTPPIIAVSADVSVNARRRCREAGMQGFVDKPVTQKKLRDVLREVVMGSAG
jgi:signal transduction histidine kinase